MRHLFIINPVSGKKHAGMRFIPLIEQAAAQCGIKAETVLTKAPRHATRLARQAAEGGEPVRLYAVGGDGTLNEVFTGAWPHPLAEVACVPCGSGNDFIRSFGTEADFTNLAAQIQGRAVPIDLMEVDGGVSAAITSTGLDAEVAYNIPKYRRIPLLGGTMAYNISILEKLAKPLGKRLQVTIDGESFEDTYLIAAVCNGQTYGGGYRAAPMASLDDGVLEVILVKKVSRLRIASIIGRYKQGKHIEDGMVVPDMRDIMFWHRAKEVTIAPTGAEPFILNVDGECGPAPRLYAKVMPRAARFVLPRPVGEGWLSTARHPAPPSEN